MKDFLQARQINPDALTIDAALEAARIRRGYARNKAPHERVAPDFLVGAHAIKQANAILTTNAGFFRQYFEGLKVVTPWLVDSRMSSVR